MATLFGSHADFAIEAGVEPDLKSPSAVWGHMCIWCRGVPLGDIKNPYCAIYPSYCAFCKAASYIDRLWDEELVGLDAVATWNHFDGLLYGYHGDIEVFDDRSIEQCHWDSVRWDRFNFLTNWGEQFDGYKSFIMRPPGGPVRILSRSFPDSVGLSVEVSRDGFVTAANGFVQWFEEQELRLRGSEA